MTTLRDRVLINIPLQTIRATRQSFRTLILVDDDVIPTDVRYLNVPLNGYADTVGSSGTVYDMCLAYFQTSQDVQDLKPPQDVVFGRLIETDSSPAFACPDYETDYTVWKLVSDGYVDISDGTNTDSLGPLDFTSCNQWSDVLLVLQTATTASSHFSDAVWSVDALGRLTLTNSTTGSSAPNIALESNVTGTDLSDDAYLGVSTGVTISGLDEMTLLESYQDLILRYTDFWGIAVRGGDDTELVELARYIESEALHFLFTFEDSAAAVNSASTSDLASTLWGTWGLKRCASTFSYTQEYPDLAQIGGSAGAEEGSCAFGFIELANILPSGQTVYDYALTAAQASVLDTKNYNYIERLAGFTNAYPGRSCAGQEIRLLQGRDWIAVTLQVEVYTARIRRKILGFDDDSLTVYEEILTSVLEEAKERKIIQSYEINMPKAADFTAAEKATHILTLDVFTAEVVTDAWKYEFTGRMVYDLEAA